MTIRKDFLIAAGTALILALPAAAQAEQPAAAMQTSGDAAARDYPPCSATVTDNCMQHQGGSHAKTHHSKSAHHKKA